MYLIPAQLCHAKQIARLLSYTGYWQFGIKNNMLGIGYEEFMIEKVIQPQLGFTTVAVPADDKNKVAGVLISGSTTELNNLPDYSQYFNEKIKEIFKPIKDLHFSDSYNISFLAIDPCYRRQKIATRLFQYAEEKAKANEFEKLSLIVWAFNVDAIIFYLKMGMMITESIRFGKPVQLPLLCFEKSKELLKLKNYFETNDYKKLIEF